MRQILPLTEIQRNNRIAELMKNKTNSKPKERTTLTNTEMLEVKKLINEGMTREEAINFILKR